MEAGHVLKRLRLTGLIEEDPKHYIATLVKQSIPGVTLFKRSHE